MSDEDKIWEEREECARIADEYAERNAIQFRGPETERANLRKAARQNAAREIAALIRERNAR